VEVGVREIQTEAREEDVKNTDADLPRALADPQQRQRVDRR
jgi:hypothetical protein